VTRPQWILNGRSVSPPFQVRAFSLYLGRMIKSKGCDQAVGILLFASAKSESTPRKLVGCLEKRRWSSLTTADINTPPGSISEQEKWDLRPASSGHASLFESLSLFCSEGLGGRKASWSTETPRFWRSSRRSGGGLAYRDEAEFRRRSRCWTTRPRARHGGERSTLRRPPLSSRGHR